MNREDACERCGRFDNRGVSIDAVIVQDGQVLLVKRQAPPDAGKWAVPGGYVEWDESAEEAACREVHEETGLDVVSTRLVAVKTDPHRHPRQVIDIVFAAEVSPGNPKPRERLIRGTERRLSSTPESQEWLVPTESRADPLGSPRPLRRCGSDQPTAALPASQQTAPPP